MYTRVRGTEDHLDLQKLAATLSLINDHLQSYNFAPIATPILEKTELFVRSVGTETDIVSKEMYTFESGSEGSICLRPELTASTVRAYLENGVESAPWKTYQVGPVFRYERPQKGRLRQFHQYNIEAVNAPSTAHDIEFLAMLDRLFAKLGLNNYVLALNYLGTSDDRAAHRTALLDFLNTHPDKICETCTTRKTKNLLRVFDCKNPDCQALYQTAPKLTDHLGEESQKDWDDLQERLQLLAINFVHNPYLVRGLDYYNGTVFEFSAENGLGAQNVFCGGGRYDLGSALGKKDLPSIGCGIGLERLAMILDLENKPVAHTKQLLVVVPMGHEQDRVAEQLAADLHRQNHRVDIIFDGNNIKKRMKRAHALNADFVLVIGEQEAQDSTVSLKNMATGQSVTVPFAGVSAEIDSQ
jgi:histidyl-tRNA synthetase